MVRRPQIGFIAVFAACALAACSGSAERSRSAAEAVDKVLATSRPPNLPDESTADAMRSADGRVITTANTGPLAAKWQSLRAVPGEYLVKFHASMSSDSVARALAKVSLRYARGFRSVPGLERIRLNPGIVDSDAVAALRALPEVEYIEPNYIVTAEATPNDPSFPQQWELNNTGQSGGTVDADIDAPEAWNVTTGNRGIVIAVIDSGVDYTHPDLAANIFQNTVDCNANGIDDDGDGYIDDCHGIDTADGDSDPMDDNHHGTHVAGSIGAVGNNGAGIAGVAWSVSILPCKFLDSTGSGTTADAVACLDYLATLKDRGVNIVASNNSWGGPGRSLALYDAIAAQMQRGILFIASAGNDGLDNDQVESAYPCAFDLPNLICVAATTNTDHIAPYSNYGSATVHIAAPGDRIYSTSLGGTYETLSGTSMASPHVTGTIALVKAQDPSRDWRALKNLVLAGSDPMSATGLTITEHRLNAAKALGCTNSTVLARLRPLKQPNAVVAVGDNVVLSALHIRCAAAAGNVTVTVNPGGESVTLLDNGIGNDAAAGDGIYSARWTPSSAGNFSLSFPETPADAVTITVDGELKPGFPVDALSLPGSYTAGQGVHVLVGNIDADPKLEILETSVALGPLLAWKSDGTRAPGWSSLPPIGAAYPALGEFNGDSSSSEVLVTYNNASTALYSGDAALQPGWPLSIGNGFPAAAADFDGDGIDEIVLTQVWRANGALFVPPVSSFLGPSAIADIDGDGNDDIIVQSNNLVRVSDPAGNSLPGFPALDTVSPGYAPSGVPVVGDLDGDGRPEIVIATSQTVGASATQLHVFAADGHLERRIVLNSQVNYATEPALADLDGDGLPEIVVQTNIWAYALKADGTALPGWPVPIGNSWVGNFAPVVGDLDGDGWPDIAIVTQDAGFSSGVVRVFDRHGTLLPGFPKTIADVGTGVVPAIADVDLDGRNDLIVGATPAVGIHHALWMYNLAGPASHGPIEWGQYREGPRHHAYYEIGKNLPNDAFLVARAGTGGMVDSTDGAIHCGTACIARYAKNASVTLAATPVSGGAFTSWGGDCRGQGNPCTLATSRYRFAVAHFLTRTLGVTVWGPGSVTSNPAGIACPTDCSEEFAPGAVVQLTATPSQYYRFSGWSGECSGTSPTCTVTLDQARSVSAEFTPMPVVIVNRLGQGNGTITSSPPGIDCGTDCSEYYMPGTVVTFTATPSDDTTFSGWSGDCTDTSLTCTLSMNGFQSIYVVYPTFDLKPGIQVGTGGGGKVTSSPPGIDCGSDCTERYAVGTVVTLTATPNAGFYFFGWGGACTGTLATCDITVDSALSVSADFRNMPSITISPGGNGSGRVTSSPTGIDCGSDCQKYYMPGVDVTLTATANPGSDFTGWAGNCSGTNPSCTLTALYAHFVVANFTLQRHTLTVTRAGAGSGNVTSNQPGIDCGAACTFDFDHGTIVRLTAVASAGSAFDGWAGACSGAATICDVTVDDVRSVQASFRLNPSSSGGGGGGGGGGGQIGLEWLLFASALLGVGRWRALRVNPLGWQRPNRSRGVP